MGSSERVDSGSFVGRRSNFSHTCHLLSRYLKDNGGLGGLSLDLTPKLVEPKGTMDLLHMIDMPGQSSGDANLAAGGEEIQNKRETETAPMTIFYAGQVMVFNNFPADKAEEIMTFASNRNAAQNHRPTAFAPPSTAQSPAGSTTENPGTIIPSTLGSDLPIARKHSLARFLEKRKDRIISNSPYPVKKPAAPLKPVKTEEPWLGLSPQFHHEILRY